MKVLFVSDHLSGEPNGAHSLALSHLEMIQKIFGAENTLVTSIVASSKDMRNTDQYPSLVSAESSIGKIANLVGGYSFDLSRKIVRYCRQLVLSEEIDVVFVDESYLGKLVQDIKLKTNAVVITFFYDIKAKLFPEWSKHSSLHRKIQLRLGVQNEKLSVHYADFNMTLNSRETKEFRTFYTKPVDFELPITLPQPKDVNPHTIDDEFVLGFMGVNYYPNVNGIRWFCQNVLPLLPPNIRLVIAGRGMEELQHDANFSDKRVNIIGGVNSLSDYYDQVDAVVAPIFEGAGMKVKTAEALSFGKLLIASPESLTGYEELLKMKELQGKIYCCENENKFASAIINVMDMARSSVDSEILEVFQHYYSRDAGLKMLSHFFEMNVFKR